EAWLLKWIHNAPSMIAAGDPIALELDAQFPSSMMTAFPQLSEDQIKSILVYVKSEEDKKAAADAGGGSAAGGAAGAAAGAGGDASNFMIIGLVAVIILAFAVILVLNKVIRTLERVISSNKGLIPEEAAAEDEKKGKDYLGQLKKLAKNKKLVFFTVLMVAI